MSEARHENIKYRRETTNENKRRSRNGWRHHIGGWKRDSGSVILWRMSA